MSVVERRLRPEPVGDVVTDLLVEHFGDFVDYDFTARMEDDLDQVAEGKRNWVPLLREFYDPFVGLVDAKRKELKRSDFTTEETDEVCSEGHPMVIRLGRNGRFLACSLYPEHRETRPLPGEEPELPAVEGVGETCPECGQGTLVAKRGKFGPVRRLLALSRLQVHPPHRAAAARAAGVRGHLPQVRRGPSRLRGERAERAASSGAARAIRSATSRRRASRSARSTTRTTGRSRARARVARSA